MTDTLSSSPQATVVVVSWNAGELLRLALDGLAKQDLPPGSFETVVVDNASADDTAAMVERDYPWVRLIRNDENLGFAGGNNSALRTVTTPVAVLLNNDAVPEPDWLRTLLAALDHDQTVGVVTGKVLFMPRFLRVHVRTPGFSPGPHDPRELGMRVHSVLVDDDDVTGSVLWERATYGPEASYRWTRAEGEWLIPVPAEGSTEVCVDLSAETAKDVTFSWDGGEETVDINEELTRVTLVLDGSRLNIINNVGGVLLDNGYGADRGYQHLDDGRFDQAAEVISGCGNGMAVRCAIGHEVGWFDEDFFLYYEDTDLSLRLRNRGWGIRYVPGAVLRHVHSASSGEESPVFRFHVDRNRLLMLTKLGPGKLARREVLRYPLTTASMTMRALIGLALRRPGRSPVRPLLLRWKVIGSYLRLLPAMLRRRGQERRGATVDRGSVHALMTPVQQWLDGAP